MTAKSPELPKIVSTEELRWLLGDLTAGRISQLEKEGIVTRVARGRYALESVPAFIKAMRDRSQGPETYQQARVAWLREKAKAAQIDRLAKEGRLVELEAVEAIESAIAIAWRNKIWAWPTRLAPHIVLCQTPAAAEQLMRAQLREHMIDFSEHGAAAVLAKFSEKPHARKRKRRDDDDEAETVASD